ncbi:MAG: hypothetical protein ACJ77B_06845 [Chloroflexota bacterium]
MTAYAMFAADQALRIANERQAEMRAQAANHRLADSFRSRRSLPTRLASALDTVRAALIGLGDVEASRLGVPALIDYPARS